MKFDLN